MSLILVTQRLIFTELGITVHLTPYIFAYLERQAAEQDSSGVPDFANVIVIFRCRFSSAKLFLSSNFKKDSETFFLLPAKVNIWRVTSGRNLFVESLYYLFILA